MISSIGIPRWQSFQESLAKILNVTTGIITSTGPIQMVFNPTPPFSDFFHSTVLHQAYLKSIHSLCADCVQVGSDPLGLHLAVFRLDEDLYLFVTGQRDNDSFSLLQEKLREFGVMDNDVNWNLLPVCSKEDFQFMAASIRQVYQQVVRVHSDNNRLGYQTVLLTAVEEISKLMVGLIGRDQFELSQILELVANSLVILGDADGAWVFTRVGTKNLFIVRGIPADELNLLKQAWEKYEPGQPLPQESLLHCRCTSTVLQCNNGTVYLGVLASAVPCVLESLTAIGRQVAIAVEVTVLITALRHRVGMVLNSIRHGVIAINNLGQLMIYNTAAAKFFVRYGLEFQVGQLLGTTLVPAKIITAVDKVIEHGSCFSKQKAVIAGSSELYLEWDAAPLIDKNGVIIGCLLVIEDDTESEVIRRQVQEWERLATAGEVAAGLAHEIRNPLATASAIVQMAELIDDPAKQSELLNKLDQELRRMNKILSNFLDFTRISDRSVLEEVNMVALVTDMEFLLRSEAMLNNIELVNLCKSCCLSPAMGNSIGIKQVFVNVAKNAIEAMPDGGKLEISCGQNQHRVWVSFRDYGLGIAPDLLPNVFRPFFTTKMTGTGLGLPISHTIVKKMSGDIRIRNESGAGTRVTVSLPRADRPQEGSNEKN